MPSRRPLADRLPPHTWFVGSAVFHYLGPAFAVLLFVRVGPLGHRMAADRGRRRRPVRLAPADRAAARAAADGARGGARGDELLLLPRDRPAAARHGRRDRVPAGHRAGRARRADPAQRARARAGRRRRLPAHRPPARGRAARLRLRVRERGLLRALHRARAPRGAGRGPRRARRVDGRGARGGHAARGLGRGPRDRRPGGDRGRHRGRGRLLGHPVRLRPDGDVAALARRLRAAGLAAAGDRDGDRHRGARPAALGAGDRGRRAGGGRRRRPPRADDTNAAQPAHDRAPAALAS